MFSPLDVSFFSWCSDYLVSRMENLQKISSLSHVSVDRRTQGQGRDPNNGMIDREVGFVPTWGPGLHWCPGKVLFRKGPIGTRLEDPN